MSRKKLFFCVLLAWQTCFTSISAFAFEGKATIEGQYLHVPSKSELNQKYAYNRFMRILKNRIGDSIANFPPNPERDYIIEISYTLPKISYAVEAETFNKLNQLKGMPYQRIRVKIKRRNLYSDLYCFSVKVLTENGNLIKVGGLLKLVPILPVPNLSIKKGDKIDLSTLDYVPVSWEFIRFSTNNNKGIALNKNIIAGQKAETDLEAGCPIYSKRLKMRANTATALRFLRLLITAPSY